MGINISGIYGNESTWLNLPDYGVKLATLSQNYSYPYFNHTIGAGLAEGNLDTLNPSICPIAVDAGSSIANGKYVMLNNENKLYIYGVAGSQTSIMFTSSFRGDGNCTNYLDYISTDKNVKSSYWNSEFMLSGPYGLPQPFPGVMTSFSQPIAEFNYKDYILVIYLLVSTTADDIYEDNYTFCDLKSYVDVYHTTYPYVNAVLLGVYRYHNSSKSYTYSNGGLSSDSDMFSRSTEQTISNFGYIPVGDVNKFTDFNAEEFLAYKSTMYYPEHYVYYNTGRYDRLTVGGSIVIGGLASTSGTRYTGELYNNHKRAVYIPDTGNMFVVKSPEARPDRVYTVHEVTDIDAFKEWCLKQTAYFGMYFSESIKDLSNAKKDNLSEIETMYLGLIDDSGITHGEYAKGKDIKNHKQSEWDSLKNQSPYDYTKRPDKSKYDDETKLNTDRLYTVGANVFTNVYALSRFTTFELRKYLYSIVAPDSTSETNTKQFLTNNPIDCIVSCMQFPFNVIPETPTGSEAIRLGNTNAKSSTEQDLSGYVISDCLRLLDFGQVELYPFFGDFRDYEPYTEILIYIPYVGYIPLSTSEFMGTRDVPRYIGVKMIVDLITGSCTALIYKNGLVIQTANGTIGLQVPITGIQQADYANAVHNAEYQSKIALASTVGSLATTAVAGMATGLTGVATASMLTTGITGMYNINNAKYNLDHTQVPFKVSGSASPACDFDNEQFCRLIIKRPVMDDNYNPTVYGSTIGFACCVSSTLNNFKGYTVCSNAIINVDCTEVEKSLIASALSSGVII